VDLLRTILLEQYGIHSTRILSGMAKGQYKIRMPKREVGKLQGLVSPFMPPMMLYRVGL